MSKIFEHAQTEAQKNISFAEKERELDLMEKANGLHSGTIIHEKNLGDGRTLETHWHPQLKEIVIVESWVVPDGDCISQEFEVLSSFTNINDFVLFAQSNK